MGNAQQFTKVLSNKDPSYRREQYRTYLTAPEWRNVEMAEELATFLKSGLPFYQYPYFSQVATLWKIFFASIHAARKHHRLTDFMFSEYMMMNLFIVGFTTIGFVAKGCLSTLCWPWMRTHNRTEFQEHIGNKVQEYAHFIHKTPFYNYPYLNELTWLRQTFKRCPDKTFADYVTLLVAGTELCTRGAISWPVAYWYNQPENQEIETLDLVVKTKKFPSKLNNNSLNIEMKQYKYKTIDHERIYYAHCRVPRYDHFGPAIRELLAQGAVIKNISGCNFIQCKGTMSQSHPVPNNLNVLYQYKNHIDNNRTLELDVEVKSLSETLKLLEQNHIQVKYLHDF